MNHDSYPDDYLRDILTSAKMIAVVGASPRPQRPSHGVMRYLQGQGYRAIPVNPFVAGGMIHGERCYASLADIPEPVEMVDVFRRADMAGGVVEAAIAIGARVVWQQLGVRNETAAAKARAAGLESVLDRCVKIEHARLFGGLGWVGVNTGLISAKRPRWLAY